MPCIGGWEDMRNRAVVAGLVMAAFSSVTTLTAGGIPTLGTTGGPPVIARTTYQTCPAGLTLDGIDAHHHCFTGDFVR
jgi:hypothetical protein